VSKNYTNSGFYQEKNNKNATKFYYERNSKDEGDGYQRLFMKIFQD